MAGMEASVRVGVLRCGRRVGALRGRDGQINAGAEWHFGYRRRGAAQVRLVRV
jgi:hypothetical protein